MINLFEHGAYLLNGKELVEDNADAAAILSSKLGSAPSKEEASKIPWHMESLRSIILQAIWRTSR